jgi:hypothetical protein
VSECEDAVLTIVHYHFTLPPAGIAEYAKLYDEAVTTAPPSLGS